jgi:hypothetical protein
MPAAEQCRDALFDAMADAFQGEQDYLEIGGLHRRVGVTTILRLIGTYQPPAKCVRLLYDTMEVQISSGEF